MQAARPGYEDSTPRPGRTVADVVPDIAAVLDAIGADTYVSIGFSGGGPHTLACAALAPRPLPGGRLGRRRRPVRRRGPGLPGRHGAGERRGVRPRGPRRGRADPVPRKGGGRPARRSPAEQVAAALGGLISGADAAVLTGEFAADLAKGLRGAVRNGIAGWRDDDLAFVADWGFPVVALTGRAAIWQGDQDNMVPFAHGQWLAAHIPGARVHLEPGAGHLTMTVTAIGRILDDLLDLARLS